VKEGTIVEFQYLTDPDFRKGIFIQPNVNFLFARPGGEGDGEGGGGEIGGDEGGGGEGGGEG
jgi:hypothetical protein